MVGKAVRAGSKGWAGCRSRSWLCLLPYFAITASYMPVFFHQLSENPQMLEQDKQKAAKNPDTAAKQPPRMGRDCDAL